MTSNLPNPIVMVIVLSALTLAPFVLVMLTSFVKISVVLSIVRNALGTQSVPPNQVITGLAFVLSFFIMAPVAKQMYNDAGTVSETRDMFSEASVKSLFDSVRRGREPLRQFLARHAHNEDRILFIELAQRLDEAGQAQAKTATPNPSMMHAPEAAPVSGTLVAPVTSVPLAMISSSPGTVASTAPAASNSSPNNPPAPTNPPAGNAASAPAAPPAAASAPLVDKDSFQVIIPAFVTSQLKEAFEVGFLIFIPFVIIDMVIANILLAMGMSMLSPSVISLPFKLLLFVLVDGWFLIIRGLVLSYV
jgi:flagellar biosynthesis protein FliP